MFILASYRRQGIGRKLVNRCMEWFEKKEAEKVVVLVGLLERSIAQYEHVHRVAVSGQLGKILSVLYFPFRQTTATFRIKWHNLFGIISHSSDS
jgi:GNAT superfamily N-acetyltransferase